MRFTVCVIAALALTLPAFGASALPLPNNDSLSSVPLWLFQSDREVAPKDVLDQITGAVDPFEEGFTRRGFLRASGKDMELDRDEFTTAKTQLLEGKEEKPWLRPFDAWLGLAKFDKKNEKGVGSNTIDWNEFHAYRKAVLAVLVKHHDMDKDGKLAGEEREEANRTLASKKLLGYLGAECCGEGKIGEATRVTRTEFFDVYNRIRKNSALTHKEIEDENSLLPFTSITERDVEEFLDREGIAGKITNEKHRRDFTALLKSELNWSLTADRDDYARISDSLFRFFWGSGGLKGDALERSAVGSMMSGGLVEKIGFGPGALEVFEGRPGEHQISEGIASNNPDDAQEILNREMRIVKVRYAVRALPTIHDPRVERLPLYYAIRTMTYAYDPSRETGAIYCMKWTQTILKNPDEDVRKFVKGPSN